MKNYLKVAMIPAIASIALLGSCNKSGSSNNNSGQQNSGNVDKTIKITYDGKTINDGDNLEITVGDNLKVINVRNGTNVTFTSDNTDVIVVGATTGKLTAKKVGTAVVTLTSGSSKYNFNVTAIAPEKKAGTFSYADASYDEKAKILGTLEKYAVDNYLTGITLFSDGGTVVYNSRYTPKPSKYVVGYGWGTEREGELTAELPNALGKKPTYYQVGMTTLPNRADAMNATGSDVSTLSGYITSAYFGTRLNETNDGYEWYPILATTNEPIALEEDGTDANGYTQVKVANGATQSDRWRIYVRTGQNGSYTTNAPKYKTASNINVFKKYNNTYVQAEDYLTPFKWMLTSANGQVRGAELLDGVSGFAGASDYYAASSDKSSLTGIYNVSAWEQYMTKGHNIVMGSDDQGTYIDFKLTVPCTQFYAKYYLSSSLYSPIPAEILEQYPKYGTEPTSSENLSQTTISCGAYYIEEKTTSLLTLSRNSNFIGEIYDKDENGNAIEKLSDDSQPRKIYQLPGIQWSEVGSEEGTKESNFLAGMVDSYSPTKDTLSKYSAGSGTNGVSWHSYQTEAESTFKINVNSLNSSEWKELFGTDGKIYAHSASETNTYADQRNVRQYMYDKDFLDFLSFGLDRKTISESRGKTPTQDYFANAYVSDPENGTVYNTTEYHKAALADRHNDTYGYDETDASSHLRESINNTIKNIPNLYTENGKFVVRVTMSWMNTTDEKDYGDVFDSIKSIFEDVSHKYFGDAYVLDIVQQNGTSDYNAVYDKMKHGEFDLGFGAISGNTMSPLNFLEVLKSDNSSGFTLNWGTDTSKVSNDIVYDGKVWSFDSLWNAGNTVAVLNKNAEVATATTSKYDVTTWASDSKKEQVSYTLAFDDLIEAGAIINSVYGSTDGFGNGGTFYSRESATTKIDENNKTLRITLDSRFNNTGSKSITDEKDTNHFKENVEATVTITIGYTIKVGGTDRTLTATTTVGNYYSVLASLESN